MSKKVPKIRWAEKSSTTDNVRNFQSRLNSGSSGGRVSADHPPSNRLERRILEKAKRRKKL